MRVDYLPTTSLTHHLATHPPLTHSRTHSLTRALTHSLARTTKPNQNDHGLRHTLNPSVLRGAFYSCFACVSLFAWVWDVKMDWGLGDPRHGYLRNKLMCPKRAWYYIAVVADLFLRFVWTLTLIPQQFIVSRLTKYPTALTAIELTRRCAWALLRVENEHLNNTRGYRHLDSVPLFFDTPIVEKTKAAGKEGAAASGDGRGALIRLSLEVAGGVLIIVVVTLGAALL
jgi:hypothetical protein